MPRYLAVQRAPVRRVATLASGAAVISFGFAFLWGPWILPLPLLLIAAGIAAQVQLERRLRAKLRADAFLSCPNCGQSLLGMDPAGACPRCHSDYTHGLVRQVWRRWIGS